MTDRLTREQIEALLVKASKIKPGRLDYMTIPAVKVSALCNAALAQKEEKCQEK